MILFYGFVSFLKLIKKFKLQAYLEAGADFIETNTFSSTAIAQSDYHMEHMVSIYKF